MNWRFNHLVWRVIPGVLTSLVCAAFVGVGAFEPLENLAYNTLFQIRGEQPWDERLLLITIDDASIQQLGRFPWPRQRYTELLRILSEGNPNNVVVFDVFFPESSEADTAFAKAITNHGQVVLATANTQSGSSLPPVSILLNAAISRGHTSHISSSDGITRRVPFVVQNDVALGFAAIQAYSLTREKIDTPKHSQFHWVNWPGRMQNLPQVSFVDVIRQRVPVNQFQNKIIFVGVTATGFDPLLTPFNQNPPANGVHLQTAISNNLLQQSFLSPFPASGVSGILILGGPLLSWVLSRKRERQVLLIWLAGVTGWSVLSLLLFQGGYWIPVVFPVGLITLTASVTWAGDRLRLDALLRQKIQQLWQTYKKDVIVRQASPSTLLINASSDQYSSASITQLTALADLFGRSQSAQAAIARSLPIGLIAIDRDGLIWFCNPLATQWLNIQVGNYFTDHSMPIWLTPTELHTTIDYLQTAKTQFSKVLQQDDSWYELKLELLNYALEPNTQPNGSLSPDGVLILIEDITIQKKAEFALEQQVQELQRLSQLKDDFLSTVSHELRSPMTNIYMAIEMLKLAKSSESSAHYLKILQAECAREIDLINDLLDLQRLEAGVHNFQLENIDVEDWLPPVIEPFYKRAEAQAQTLEIEVDAKPTVVSDQSSLERVLVELVTNACKYTPPNGHISVEVSANHSSLLLSVSNSGTEIPKTELLRIFEKFYRIPHADPWKRGGTGLGLALVKKLVERLGGTIQVSSGSGRTTFTVQLPLTHPEISGL